MHNLPVAVLEPQSIKGSSLHLRRDDSNFDEDIIMIDTSSNRPEKGVENRHIENEEEKKVKPSRPPAPPKDIGKKFKKLLIADDSSMVPSTLNRSFFVLYESYEDFSSEYKMSKIKLNENDYWSLFKEISSEKIRTVGFYGDFEKSY